MKQEDQEAVVSDLNPELIGHHNRLEENVASAPTEDKKSRRSRGSREKSEIGAVSWHRKQPYSAPTARTHELAKFKPVPAGFLDDKRSVYWNTIPEKDYTKTTRCLLTNRMEELTKPKSLHNEYSGDRPSPIWDVSTASRTHTPTLRTFDLARAKTVHMEYRPCRSVETDICPAAKRAVASARIEQLSNPKKDKRSGGEERCEEWGQPAWDISQSAKNATATEHLEKLAVAKGSHPDYNPPQEVQWKVTIAAKRAIASERIQKLSSPKLPNPANEDFNPNAWRVSDGAKRMQPSAHISSLALPLNRKTRQKFVKAA